MSRKSRGNCRSILQQSTIEEDTWRNIHGIDTVKEGLEILVVFIDNGLIMVKKDKWKTACAFSR